MHKEDERFSRFALQRDLVFHIFCRISLLAFPFRHSHRICFDARTADNLHIFIFIKVAAHKHDVIAVLTDSRDAAAYWRKLKQRLKAEGNETVTICHGLKMTVADGKMRITDVVDAKQLFRLVQSILSPKAEPFKQRLASLGREWLEEIDDSEIDI